MQTDKTTSEILAENLNYQPSDTNNLTVDDRYQAEMPSLDFGELALYWLRHWKVLLLALILGAGIGYGYHTFFIDDLYQADTSLFIADSSKVIDVSSLSLSSALSSDYQRVLTSRGTMKEVVEDLNLDMDYRQLRGMVYVGQDESAHILTISATTTDPDLSREIANSMSRVGIARMQKVIAKCDVTVVDRATNDAINTVTPNILKYIGVGGIVGLCVPLALLALLYLMDNTFKSEEDVLNKLKKPVLSSVPYYGRKNIIKTQLNYYEKEAFNTLYGNINLSGAENRIIAMTSANANEGKSSLSFKLAEIITNYNKKVCYVDCDMRNSNFYELYGIDKDVNPGLSAFLSGNANVEEIMFIDKDNSNLYILPAGKNPPNPSALVSGDRFQLLLVALRKKFDYVIIDTPPVNAVIDGMFIANQCDGTVLVIESGITDVRHVMRAMNDLNMSQVNVLGIVINKVGLKAKRGYGYGTYGYGKRKGYGASGKYGYGYGYGYGNGYGYGYGYSEIEDDSESSNKKGKKKNT